MKPTIAELARIAKEKRRIASRRPDESNSSPAAHSNPDTHVIHCKKGLFPNNAEVDIRKKIVTPKRRAVDPRFISEPEEKKRIQKDFVEKYSFLEGKIDREHLRLKQVLKKRGKRMNETSHATVFTAVQKSANNPLTIFKKTLSSKAKK